jgi:uncharacterized protein (TIGR03118 family)
MRRFCPHAVARISVFAVAVFSLLVVPRVSADSTVYARTNLVSDIPAFAAVTDPNLVNPWGLASGPTSPFWVSDEGTSVATLYNVNSATNSASIVPLIVNVPQTNFMNGPTGIVFASGDGFGGSPFFIFATLTGTVATWSGGNSAMVATGVPGAVFTGLAVGFVGSNSFLYAADSQNGAVDVFDSNYHNVTGTAFAGKFVDPNPVAGFVPFNIQTIGTKVYVTYAQIGPGGVDLPGGYIDVYDTSGNFIQRLATGGTLFAPWGLAIAPAGFGAFAGDLLVGNNGNGEINAFTLTGTFVGTVDNSQGQPLETSGLWGLRFGNSGAGGNSDTLYFNAGINGQRDGLFGSISPVETPEPGTFPLLAAGLTLLLYSCSGSSRLAKR